jgi:hypothetical protein
MNCWLDWNARRRGVRSGPETPEAVETETQGQEEPTAEPAVEVTPEEQQMYEDTREYHNGIEPDARLHLPEFGALSPEKSKFTLKV